MRGKFLEFKDISTPNRKTKSYAVHSAHTRDYIGIIEWHKGWRRYVLLVEYLSYWSVECLSECYKFIQKLMNERKKVGK